MSSTYTDKKNSYHDVQRDIPNLEFSPSHASIGSSQIAFPIIVLPKEDRTDSVQEEQLGLPYLTMMLAICVVVDGSKCLDTPILEFSIICEHLPFLLGYKQIQDTCKFRLEIISLATGLSMLASVACLARHGKSHRCFQFLASVLDVFFWNPYTQGQWNRFFVIFWHYRVWVFHETTFASVSAGHFYSISSRVLSINR